MLYPIRLVVLDYPFKHWDSKEIQDLFSKMVLMKREGYWGIHQNKGFLPVDQTDFIGTNFIICYDTPEGLIPFTSYRTVSVARCEAHRVTFPPLNVLQSSGQSTENLEQIIANAKSKGRGLTYHSSFTKNALMPENIFLAKKMRAIITGTAVGLSEYVHEFLGCGAIKFKMDDYFLHLGATAITETFSQYSVFGVEAKMFHQAGTHCFTPGAIKDFHDTFEYWENRIEIGEQVSESTPLKRAA